MSNKNKLTWFVFMVLVGLMGYLVALSFVKSGTASNATPLGLECVYSCDGYNVMLESLEPSSGLKMSHSAYSSDDRLQPTQPVQKTQSGVMLHELSIGVELRPLEMLRSGRLNTPKQLINVCNNQYGYIVISGCGYEVVQ